MSRRTGRADVVLADDAEVRWDAFALPDDKRQHNRGFLAGLLRGASEDAEPLDRRVRREARRAGRRIRERALSDRGLFLIGGATAHWAKRSRRSARRSVRGARWRYGVERGTPALTVHAISTTSSPILRRIGFREVCTMRHLEGTPT